jgi:hypothetical protein
VPFDLRHAPVGLTAVLALVAVLGAGCTSSPGSSSTSQGGKATTTTTQPLTGFAAQSPQAILSAGCGATQPLSSVAVATTFSKPSLVGGVSSMTWSMSTAANQGTLHYGKKITVQAIVIPFTTFVRAPASWWATTAASAGATALANRWISIGQASTYAPIAQPLISFSNLSSMLTNCLPTGQQVVKGQLGAVGSEQTINVVVQAGFTTQTLSIPTTSIPYILKSVMLSAQVGQETSLLSGFDAQKAIAAPATSTSIESALAG